MRRALVLVLLVGCRHNSSAEVVDYPVRTPPIQPAVHVELTKPGAGWWCYREKQEITGDGLCSDLREVCYQHLVDHEKFDFVQIVGELEKDRKAGKAPAAGMADDELKHTASYVATHRYTECEQSAHAACFTGSRVVDRTNFELCYPTMKRCSFVEGNNRRDVDVVVTTPCTPL